MPQKIDRLELKLNVSSVDGAVAQAEKINDNAFLNQYQSFPLSKGCNTKVEDVVTTMNLQIVNFTSIEDVIKYNYNEETLKLSLTFKSTTDN